MPLLSWIIFHYMEFFEVKIQFDVYKMERDYSEWFVKYRVDLSPVVASYAVIYMDDFEPTPYGFSIFTLVGSVRGGFILGVAHSWRSCEI
ncbi:hypothetical protein ACS0TY_017559 [Phlomoides rotata]